MHFILNTKKKKNTVLSLKSVHFIQMRTCTNDATYTAASGDGDLDGVTPPCAHILQVERFVRRLVLSPFNVERSGIDTDGDGGGPVGVLLPVFVVETLQLQLQVRPAHSIRNKSSLSISCRKYRWPDI